MANSAHRTLVPRCVRQEAIEQDWGRVRKKAIGPERTNPSESDGRLLGPCTKGVDGSELRKQPFSDVPAKPRAWALKPPFVLGIYEESRSSEPRFDLVVELLGLQHLIQGLMTRVGQIDPMILLSKLEGHLARPRTTPPALCVTWCDSSNLGGPRSHPPSRR